MECELVGLHRPEEGWREAQYDVAKADGAAETDRATILDVTANVNEAEGAADETGIAIAAAAPADDDADMQQLEVGNA